MTANEHGNNYIDWIVRTLLIIAIGLLTLQTYKIYHKTVEQAYIEGSIKTIAFVDCINRYPSSGELVIMKNLDLIMGCDVLIENVLEQQGKLIRKKEIPK